VSSLIVTTNTGLTKTVEGSGDLSVMEIIRGCCSCATCHVIVHPDDFARLSPIGEDEDDLLDTSSERAPTSRLSCQIKFGPELDGLRVTIAKEA
jgi:2Fe-2S ferredoxin